MIILLLHAFLGFLGLSIMLAFFFLVLFLSGNGKPIVTGQTLSDEFMVASKPSDLVASEYTRKKAVIKCDCIFPAVAYRFAASGFNDCRSMSAMFDGNMNCTSACLGLGSCAQLCPNDSIHLKDGVVCVLDSCTGCGHCLSACPKGLISLLPANEAASFVCNGAKKSEMTDTCPTAGNSYTVDLGVLSKSGFKRNRI